MTDKLDKVREGIARWLRTYKLNEIEVAALEVEDGIATWERCDTKEFWLRDADKLFSLPIEVEPEKPCPRCGGEGYLKGKQIVSALVQKVWLSVDCPTCKGSGVLPARVKTIETILGEAIR